MYLSSTPEIISSRIKKDLYYANAVEGECQICHGDIITNPD